MRTVGVVTTSRADYGLLRPVLREIVRRPGLDLRLLVTGAHLIERYGRTVGDVEADGFPVAARVPIPVSETPAGVARAMGETTAAFAEVFAGHRPDILLVLGDRYEMHAAALAAVPFGIPIAHIHGGESTRGAFDDTFRHALTKISHLHFAATEEAGLRIRAMGEAAWRVTVTGSPGLDPLRGFRPLPLNELRRRFGLPDGEDVILVTLHPETRAYERTGTLAANLLLALEDFPGYSMVFTHPNADPGSDVILEAVRAFVRRRERCVSVPHLGTEGYWSLMAAARAMVGNSSSGIIEAASFGIPVVNIGTRQEGRLRPANVIDCGVEVDEIRGAVRRALSPEGRRRPAGRGNPYGDGRAAERIVAVLESVDLSRLIRKEDVDGS